MFDRLKSFRFWFLQLGLTACWIGSWHVGRMLEHTTHASLWFPPAALTFAMFAIEGALAFPAVLVAAIVTTFQSAAIHGDTRAAGAILVSGISFGLAHSLAYGTGAWLFDRLDRADRLGTPRSVVGFLLVATLSSLLAATTGFEAVAVTGEAIPGGLAENLVAWWIGDLAAVVTLVPVLLTVVDWGNRIAGLPAAGWAARLRRLGLSDVPFGGFMLRLAISVGLVVGFGALAAVGSLGIPVALAVYVLIVPLMWIAHTDGGLRTMVAVAVLAFAVVTTTSLLGLTEQAFNYQAAMVAIAATGLFNVAVPRLYADNRRLRNRLTYDQLTGARTRTAFHEAAEEALVGRGRRRTPSSLIVLDVDHFKRINDTFGHAAGDAVLEGLGRLFRGTLRGSDLFGRLGGEEFAVFVPDAGRKLAVEIAERLRTALADVQWPAGVADAGISASFGVAEVAQDETLASALTRADRALYRAKAEGRDQVCVD